MKIELKFNYELENGHRYRNKKCDYKMGFMVVHGQSQINRIHIGEIGIVIVESTAVSFTSALLSELVKNKIKVIFCDEKHNPISELIPYYGSHDTSVKVREQIGWKDNIKKMVWTEIISEKIRNQQKILKNNNKEKEAEMLLKYVDEIELFDSTNREGHAAKVYFNALFGKDFSRSQDNAINACLNYGYSIILSFFNREIVSNGYITQLGLYHSNMYNQFNLSSDLMEPFRYLVDKIVLDMNPECCETDEKHFIVGELFDMSLKIDGRVQFFSAAIKIYTKSIFDALGQEDISLIRFYSDEL